MSRGLSNLEVKYTDPNTEVEHTVYVSEEALKMVMAWAGSPAETAGILGWKVSKIHSVRKANPDVDQLIVHNYMMTQHKMLQGMGGAIADRIQIQQFWTREMYDLRNGLRERLAASTLLAKSHGMFIERIEAKTELTAEVQQYHLALEERVKAIDAKAAQKQVEEWME